MKRRKYKKTACTINAIHTNVENLSTLIELHLIKGITFVFLFQYLGSFPVESSSDLPDSRAEVVRKHLDGMQDVPSKRPVLIVVSLAGIKVCCPQGQVRQQSLHYIHYVLNQGVGKSMRTSTGYASRRPLPWLKVYTT